MSVVFLGDVLEVGDDFLVFAYTKKVFGGFAESDNSDTSDAHEKDETTTAKPHVSPAHIVGLGTGRWF